MGTCLTICIGTQRLHGKLLDFQDFKAILTSAPTGKGGVFGSKGQFFEYYSTLVIALAQGPCIALRNVWSYSGILENLSGSYSYTVPSGGGTVAPIAGNTAPIQNNLGVTKSVAYSVATNDYGGAPSTLSGTQQVPMTLVSSSPGAGEYTFNPSTGVYGFGAAEAGSDVAISYSSMFSLYYYEQTQAGIIPGGTYTIDPDNLSYFYADDGVLFVDTNTPGVKVSGTPTASGEYWVNFGTYVFYSGDVGRMVYISYTYITNSSTITSSSVLNLTFFNGAQGQAPWSYMVSAHPSNAFGYSGICYVASDEMDLGQTASVPPYNYEVIGQAIYPGQIDSMVCDVITLLLTNALCGIDFPASALDTAGTWVTASAHWVANGYFISDNLTAQSGIADILKKYCDAGNTAAFFSGGLLKLVPYSETSAVGNGATYTPPTNPVATLTWDDLIPPGKDKPGRKLTDDFFEVDETAVQDRYNYTQCNWSDRTNSYNNALMTDQNDSSINQYGIRIEDAQAWTFICLEPAAQWALNCHLKRNVYINKKYKFTLKYTFDYLEPMDVVVLPSGISVRITQVNEDEKQFLDIEAENFIYGGSSATLYPTQPGSPYQPVQGSSSGGVVYPAFVQKTVQQSGNTYNQIQIAVGATSDNFGGCQVWLSTDTVNYSQIGTINENNSLGVLTAALPAGTDPDTTDTLSVDMTLSGKELVGATQTVADTFGTLCAIISPDGSTCEFISYENVTLTAANRYNLTYLRRGVYGSPVSSFSAGSNFVYIGSFSLFTYLYQIQYVGQTIYLKFPSFNLQGGATTPLVQCKAWPLVIGMQGAAIVETYVPSTATEFSAGLTNPIPPTSSNIPYAYDRNFSTVASLYSGVAISSGTQGVIGYVFAGFGTGTLTANATAYVALQNISGLPNPSGGPSEINITISLDGGVTQTPTINLNPVAGAPFNQTVSFAVPAGQDLSQVQISVGAYSGGYYSTSPYASCNIAEIWIQ